MQPKPPKEMSSAVDYSNSATYLEHLKSLYLEQIHHQGKFGGLGTNSHLVKRDVRLKNHRDKTDFPVSSVENSYGFFPYLRSSIQSSHRLMLPENASGQSAHYLTGEHRSIRQTVSGRSGGRPFQSSGENHPSRARFKDTTNKETPVKVKIGRITYSSENEPEIANSVSRQRPAPAMKLADYNRKRRLS